MWVIWIIGIGILINEIRKFEKDPEAYDKRKKKFMRTPINPVASNAELFDAFGYKPELKRDSNNDDATL